MKKKQRWLNLIWKFIILTLLLLAFFLAIRDGLEIDWWGIREVFPVCLMAAALVTVSGYNRWLTLGGSVLGALVWGSVFCLNRSGLLQELWYYSNHVTRLADEYYGTSYRYSTGLLHGETAAFLLVVALPLGALLGLGIHSGKGKNGKRQWWRVLFLLPLALAFASGLMLGYGPGIMSVLCLVLGLAFRLLLSDGQVPVMRQRRNLLVFLCMCAAIVLSASFYIPLSGKVLEYHKSLRTFQVAMEDSIKAAMEGGILSELKWRFGLYDDTVRMTNREPSLTSDKIFTVTVTEKPASALYFKTFVGGDYDKGVWYAADEKEFADFCKEQGIDSQVMGEYALTQRGILTTSFVPQPWDMTVQIVKRKSNLSPYPYYYYGVSIPKEAEVIGDSGIRVAKESSYELIMGTYNPYLSSAIQKDTDAVILNNVVKSSIEQGVTENFQEYENVLIYQVDKEKEAYQAYVEEVYTRLPKDQLLRLREAYESGYFNSLSNLNCRYSLDLDPVPKGEDVIEYFLLDSREGYCMHFASAVTILCRMMGIPARYVSGYVVSPNEFVENEDGTYTAVVTGKRAHAWVEMYSEMYGWMYSEQTPSNYAERFLNAELGESLRDIVRDIRREDQPSDTPEPDPEPDTDNTPNKKPNNPVNNTTETPTKQPDQPNNNNADGARRRGGIFGLGIGFATGNAAVDVTLTVVVYLLFVVLLLGIVILAFCLHRRQVWRRRNRSFRDPDDKRAAAAIVLESLRLLAILGITFTGGEDEIGFANEAEGKLPCMKEGNFVEFVEIARAARYGAKPLTEGELQYLRMIYKRLRSYTAAQLRRGRRLWYRYIVVRV